MKRPYIFVVLVVLLAVWRPILSSAQSSSSDSYQVNESFFGTGGEVDTSSSSYQAQGAAGPLGVGESDSSSYDTVAGFIDPVDEYLEMVVDQATIDFGTLSVGSTATGSGTFHVRAYLNGSYSVITMSSPPTSEGGAILDGISSPAAPTVGQEEFGINLVDNSSPNIGADPDHIPDSTYANGEAAADYNTPNSFKYLVGDIIAQSGAGRAWGQTNFTISYIANIANTTPAGLYVMNHDLLVIATF